MANNKCKSCGGMYEYSPKDNALKCLKCGGLKGINSSHEIMSHKCDEKLNFDNTWAKEIRHLRCSECGAEVVLNHLEIINKCSYCGNTSLVDVEEFAQVVPDSVIPFKFDKNEALKYFKEGLRKKRFVPNSIKKSLPDVNLTSAYVGTYMFTGEAKVKYDGVLIYYDEVRDKNGHTSQVSRTKRVDSEIDIFFTNRIYECSSILTQYDFKYLLPYEITEQRSYNVDYLLGSSAEYSDMSVESAEKLLKVDLKKEVERKILNKHFCDKVRTLNLNFEYSKKEYVYCLVPTYIFNYNYKGKNYKTIMNGQTGKLGCNVPKSPVKIALFILFITLLIGGLLGFILF